MLLCRAVTSLIIARLLLMSPAAADDNAPHIIFGMMEFSDTGDAVHVEGTLTGEGIGYKDNRSSLTCYRDSRECIVVQIEALGLQVFPLGIPGSLTVRVWAVDRIVADESAPCGTRPDRVKPDEWQATSNDTWIIDRNRHTVEMILHACLGSKTYHWTLEDPPFWKKAKEDAVGRKLP
jgi:hypothetical protein